MPCYAPMSPLTIYLTAPFDAPEGVKSRMRRGYAMASAFAFHTRYAMGLLFFESHNGKQLDDARKLWELKQEIRERLFAPIQTSEREWKLENPAGH